MVTSRQYIDSYQSIKQNIPVNLRSVARNMALTLLTLKDRFTSISDYLKTPRVQFLYIHHSFRDELSSLDCLLKQLSIDHTFISYSEAVSRVLENRIDKPYISISSDDGFKNNLLAAEILNNYGAKACFFINPGLIEENDFEKIRRHCSEKLHLPPIEFLNWNDIQQLLVQGHEIGGHTMYHDNMAAMKSETLQTDIKMTFDIITARCGKAEHFAFPYGKFINFSEFGRKTVFENGFKSCASAERGCHFNHQGLIPSDRLCIRRDHVLLDWNINHIFYFLANNVRKEGNQNNFFPYKQHE